MTRESLYPVVDASTSFPLVFKLRYKIFYWLPPIIAVFFEFYPDTVAKPVAVKPVETDVDPLEPHL